MKYALALAALIVCGIAAPAMADNGHVPSTTLSRLGLQGMHAMSDADGMQVRGMGGGGGTLSAMGLSVVSGVIIHPSTKDFVSGTSANSAMANAEFKGGHKDGGHGKHGGHGGSGGNPGSAVSTNQASFVGLNLEVIFNTDVFNAVLVGGAGGTAVARGR